MGEKMPRVRFGTLERYNDERKKVVGISDTEKYFNH